MYISIFMIIGYARMFERLVIDSGGFWSQFGPPIGATIISVGIFCWLRNTATINIWFWKIVHAVIGLVLVVSLAFSFYLAATSGYAVAGRVFIIALILAPAFYGLFQFSYRSSKVWSETRP